MPPLGAKTSAPAAALKAPPAAQPTSTVPDRISPKPPSAPAVAKAKPSAWWEQAVIPDTLAGYVEILSVEFVAGWAEAAIPGGSTHVVAMVGSRVIGSGIANLRRADLDGARAQGAVNAYAFIIIFDQPISPDEVEQVDVISVSARRPFPRARSLKIDRAPPMRVFLLGSPRSGTSEMGSTITKVLGLPWVGEGHVAALFAQAANALQGDSTASNGLVRFMGVQNYRGIAQRAAKETYFFGHGSSSFVDKTPGAPMIRAVPFLYECFPEAYFIFLWRNPVANVLSRMVKFGGQFDGHCRDWAASMQAWHEEREKLPHYLEIRQEDMAENPAAVGKAMARYLGMEPIAAGIAESLSAGSHERTGAGLGKTSVRETSWTPEQIATFSRICGPMMKAFQQRVDEAV